MFRKGLLLILLSMVSLPVLAISQNCTAQKLNNLMLVDWGGMWKKGKEMGYIRVLVYRKGWKPTRDVIQFQVMQRDYQHKRILLRHCAELKVVGSRPPVIKGINITELSNVKSQIRLSVLTGTYPGIDRYHYYTIDVDGKVMRERWR